MKKIFTLLLLTATIFAGKANFNASPKTFYPAFYFKTGITSCDINPAVNFNTAVGTYTTYNVALADFDGDGKKDIVSANGEDNTISILQNIHSGSTINTSSFAPKVVLPTGRVTWDVTVGDFNGDGKPDIASANAGSNNVTLYLNTHSGGAISASSFATRINIGVGDAQSIKVGDIDGDGKQDIVVGLYGGSSVVVLRNTTNNGSVSFATTNLGGIGGYGIGVSIGDLDGDGKPDVAFTTQYGGLHLYRNLSVPGQTLFEPKVTFTAPSAQGVAIADLNNDGKLDITVSSFSDNKLYVFENRAGSGSFSASTLAAKVDFPTFLYAYGLATGDMDGDGSTDIVVVEGQGARASILRNNNISGPITSSSFEPRVGFSAGSSPYGVALGDMDGDGRLDMVVANQYSRNVSVFQNNPAANTINTTGTLTPFLAFTGSANASQNFTVSGASLTADLVITAPSGFSIALSETGSYSNSINLTPSGGTINNTTIYVKINNSVAGSFSGNITLTSACTASQNIAVSGSVAAPPPTISISGTPTSFSACVGTASAAQSISVSGSNLTITAPTGFEISLSSGGSYSNSLNITPSAGTVASTSIFVRLSSAATATPSGNVSVASTGATTQYVAVSGTINPLPTANITTSGPTTFCAGGSVNLSATGNALTLGAGRYVSVPHSSLNSLGSGTTYTIEAWIKVADGANNTIVDKGDYNFLFQTHSNGNGGLGLYNRSFGWIYSAGTVPVNQWVHVAVTYDNRTVKFYQNGVLQGTYTASTNSTGTTGPLNIGRQSPSNCSCNTFDGTMDELRMWNVAKSQSDIQAKMNASVPSNSAGLVAYYKFDEGTGSSITDATSNLNNGSMVGTPIWQVPSTSPLNGSNSSYLWSPGGATTQSITANTSGNYTLTVTNQNGCTATSAATAVTVNPLPTISAITGTTSICSGSSTSLTATSAAASPIFKWYSASTGGSLLFTGATFTTPNLVSNTTYYVEVSNANACASAARTPVSVAVTTINNQTVSLSSSQICGSGVATVSLASSQAGINYTLRNNANNAIVAGPIQGNGGPLNFNTGTISSTTTYNVLAQTASSGAITFNGSNQYVKAPLNGSQLSSFTIEMWVNPNTGANSGIFQWANGVGTGVPYVYWYYSGATLTMYINGNYYIATNVPTGAWSHIALTFNGSLWSLYKNGALQATYAGGSNKSIYPPDDLYFGNGYHGYFNGRIDEARIWSVVRTQAEIQGAMSACLTGSENGLLANYKFDDGSGLTAIDSKGGINGTLTNMSASTAWVAGNVNCGSQASCSLQMSNTVTATVNPLPTAAISGTTAVCLNAATPSVTFTGTNATAPYTFTYTINGGAEQTVTSVGNIATVNVPTGVAGTYTYALVSVKDASSTLCSNTATGSAVVTVNSAPVFTVSPGNQTATNSTGLNSAIVSYNATVTASPSATLSYTFSGATTGSGTGTGSGQIFNIGITNVVITATNTCGSVTNSFTIQVNDITPPTINTVSNISTNATSANGAVVNYTAPIGTDNVGGSTTAQTTGLASGSTFPLGTTTNTFVVTDGAGLTATTSFTVTITGIAPVLETPANIIVNNAPGVCGANVTYGATQSTVGIPASTITYSIEPGSLFAVGTTEVTVTATNAVGSNSKTFTVTVNDTEKPTIIAPANKVITTDANSNVATNVNLGTPVTADNCAVIGITNNAPSVFPIGTTTVTWIVTDASENSTTSTQTVTVEDKQAPTVVTKNITVYLGANGQASITTADVNNGSTDNTSIATYSLNNSTFNCSNVGANTVTLTVTDIYGNSASAAATVIVSDIEKPTVRVNNVTVTLVNGAASVTSTQINNNSTDNCSIKSIVLTGKTIYTCADLGQHTVTLTVTDIYNNVSSANAIVTVAGVIPAASISAIPSNNMFTGGIPTNLYLGYGPQSLTLQVNATGGAPYTYSWSGNGTLSSNTASNPVFTATASGSYTFTVTVTNVNGCRTTTSVSICVRDIRVPGTNGNAAKVYLCHVPPGNKNNPQQLSISVNAVNAHLTEHTGDRLGTCGMLPCSSGITVNTTFGNIVSKEQTIEAEELKVTVMPNPTTTYFTIKLSSKSVAPVNIKVMDASGRAIESKPKVQANSTIQLGYDYAGGTYFMELIQDNKRKVVQLIKGRG